MSRPVPSREELLKMMEAKVAEARRSLQAAAAAMPFTGEQHEECARVMSALDELEARIRKLRES